MKRKVDNNDIPIKKRRKIHLNPSKSNKIFVKYYHDKIKFNIDSETSIYVYPNVLVEHFLKANTFEHLKSIEKIKSSSLVQEKNHCSEISVYIDGSCKNNGKKDALCGIGIYFGENDERNVSEKACAHINTNNRAEIYAAIRLLEILKGKENDKIMIYSDSQLVVNTMNGQFKKGKNLDLWSDLEQKSKLFKHLEWIKCKGHDSINGNIQADLLAKKAIE